ncbi:MAG: GIY-YIG nuclease family protein [Alphaproteobacteria bacterium]
MSKQFYVYFVTNWKNTVLYTGVTSDLERRIYEHENKIKGGFTAQYNCRKLVYYEIYGSAELALKREKTIKGWIRGKKNALVDKLNPKWIDIKKNNLQLPLDPSSQSSSG